MALILIIIIFIIVFAHKFYYYAALTPFQVPCSEDTNTHAQLNSTWLDHLGKWRPIRDQIFAVVETVFFEYIISVIVDQNFTMNAIGMVLESV